MFVFVFTALVLPGSTVTVGEENTCDTRNLTTLFVKMLTTENTCINAKIEESTNAFLTELKVMKQHATQQDNEVTTLKANYVEAIKQINETVQAENKDIKERLDEIVKNMTVLATKLDVFLTAMDGSWSSWSNWNDCSVTCGYGLSKRTRVCNNTEPFGVGRGCVGNNEEVMTCNTFQCPNCAINSCKKVPKYNATYDIYPGEKCNRMVVYCDHTTDGGGWIVIQRRKDGSIDFERTWADYKSGFGDLEGEFWLGNDNIHTLTAAGFSELRVDMGDFEGNTAYAKYSNFSIKSESDKYTLTVSGYSGNAGDSLTYQNGMAFSTRDRDHDLTGDNCAVVYRGAWWYRHCHHSNLNGYYYHGAGSPFGEGINWYFWKGHTYSLKFVEMKIR